MNRGDENILKKYGTMYCIVPYNGCIFVMHTSWLKKDVYVLKIIERLAGMKSSRREIKCMCLLFKLKTGKS